MPNIILTTYCNLHCPYCFANKMIATQEIKNITIKQFSAILRWIEETGPEKEKLGLIGGEPLLHPEILSLLEIADNHCQLTGSPGVLFTNGIYLDKIIYDMPNSFTTLININSPTTMTEEQYLKLQKNLNIAYRMGWFIPDKIKKVPIAALGCNLCPELDNYDFFWEMVDQCHAKDIRVSVTAPTSIEALQNKELYYTSMKTKFLNFIKEARIRENRVSLDCNQIPQCYFSAEELINILKVTNHKQRGPLCKPVIDITPDFKASSCFGAYDSVDCTQFNSYRSLEAYLLYKKVVPLTLANTQGKCATCKEHELLQCQGGCLAFAKSI